MEDHAKRRGRAQPGAPAEVGSSPNKGARAAALARAEGQVLARCARMDRCGSKTAQALFHMYAMVSAQTRQMWPLLGSRVTRALSHTCHDCWKCQHRWRLSPMTRVVKQRTWHQLGNPRRRSTLRC